MTHKWLPLVDEDRCTGCGLCVDACGPGSLEMVNGMPKLVLPDTCGSEEHCIAVCRDDAIRMDWVSFAGNKSVGLWDDTVAPNGSACVVKS